MTNAQGNTWRVLGPAVAIVLLTGCTSSPATQPPPSTTGTTSAAVTRAAPPVTPLACDTPPKALLQQAAESIAAHPGRITGASYVFAATTDTGDWYVLALDRGYVRDDGSPGTGPDGDHSRSLALTKTARSTPYGVALIPLEPTEKAPVSSRNISWDRVSWTGETLASGRRAAELAISCLEGQRG